MSNIRIVKPDISRVDTLAEFSHQIGVLTENILVPHECSKEMFTRVIQNEDELPTFMYMALDGEKPIGFVFGTKMMWLSAGGWRWFMNEAYVLKEYRGQGLFRMMFDKVCEEAREDPNSVGV